MDNVNNNVNNVSNNKKSARPHDVLAFGSGDKN